MITYEGLSEQHKKELMDALNAFNAHDIEKFLLFSADDIMGENVALGTATHGKEESRKYFSQLFAAIPNIKIEPTLIFCSGKYRCMEYVMSGMPVKELGGIPASGKSFAIRCAGVSEVKDGKTFRASTYSDLTTMLRQLGVLPPMSQK